MIWQKNLRTDISGNGSNMYEDYICSLRGIFLVKSKCHKNLLNGRSFVDWTSVLYNKKLGVHNHKMYLKPM